jgi:hypothetical protein
LIKVQGFDGPYSLDSDDESDGGEVSASENEIPLTSDSEEDEHEQSRFLDVVCNFGNLGGKPKKFCD